MLSWPMLKRASHPYTINIGTRRWMGKRFGWAIRQGGQVIQEGPVTYESFEAARAAGKDVLDQMIAGWVQRVA